MTATALELRLPPHWEVLPSAWEPCCDLLGAAGLSRDDVFALCMVVQELLENAVKYGRFEHDGDAITVRVSASDEDVVIEVRNPLGVDDPELQQFEQSIQWIRGFQDPFEGYVEKLKRVSQYRYGDGKSGLGLTRMAYEGHCLLDFYVDDENTVSVCAVYPRGGGQL
jgi:hypothetical protein